MFPGVYTDGCVPDHLKTRTTEYILPFWGRPITIPLMRIAGLYRRADPLLFSPLPTFYSMLNISCYCASFSFLCMFQLFPFRLPTRATPVRFPGHHHWSPLRSFSHAVYTSLCRHTQITSYLLHEHIQQITFPISPISPPNSAYTDARIPLSRCSKHKCKEPD